MLKNMKHSHQNEPQFNNNQNITHQYNIEQRVTQEEKWMRDLKRILSEKSTIPSLKSQDWETVKAENKKE